MDQNTTPNATDTSKNCQVTNQSNTDAVIIIPTTAQDGNEESSIAVYDQSLEILNTLEGGIVIKVGQSGTVVLDQYYIDPKTGQKTYSLVYNLLVSSSSWYYPLANIGLMQNIFVTPPNFTPQTATGAEQQSIANADVFYQTIQAYPTSQLAQNYQAAMSGTISSASAQADGSPNSTANTSDAITQSVNAFFQSTKQFQNVTLASLVAVESYYNEFPFIWAQYKSVIYYLYSSDGKTTSFVGQLGLKQPATLDLTVANGGYICTFTPAKDPSNLNSVDVDSSKAMNLTYSSGVFVNDVNVDVPAIALKGIFQLKRLFTQVPADTQILPVITGSVDGVTAVGFDQPQLEDDPSGSDFWNTLFHPKNSAEVFNSIMEIGGAIMMLHFFATSLYGMGKWLKQKLSGKKTTTAQDEFNQKMDEFQKTLNEKIDSVVQKISDNKGIPPKDPSEAMDNLSRESGSVVDNLNAGNLQDGLKSQANNLEELAQYESQMSPSQLQSLESNASAIQKSNDALNNASKADLNGVVKEQQANFSDIQSNVGNLTSQMDKTISDKSKAEIERNNEASKEVSENIENSEKNQAEEREANDPEAKDPIEPEFEMIK
ncbi:MAG: hypothetical protein U0X71_08020 [Sphingobacteriaceae bacterium]